MDSRERLRTLERAWRASGALEDHAALLRERWRAGVIEGGLLGLAAHLGHAAARVALGDLAPEEADRRGWAEGWAEQAARLCEGQGASDDRIWFPGNPWPAGHRLQQLVWAGVLSEEGLRFHLHLESVDYDAEDDEDDEDEDEEPDEDLSDWAAEIVWGNYHACRLSSSAWHEGGFTVGTPTAPLDFERLGQHALRVDAERAAPSGDWEEAFHVYLLGHDSVADHRILFTPNGDGTHRLEWSGRIALTYVGHTDYAHRFYARASRVSFAGFLLAGRGEAEARRVLASCVTDPEAYALVGEGPERRFERAR